MLLRGMKPLGKGLVILTHVKPLADQQESNEHDSTYMSQPLTYVDGWPLPGLNLASS